MEALTNQKRTALHLAAARGHTDICRLLCDQLMVNRNVQDVEGNTPLHLSARSGQLDVIKFLIVEASVDHTIKNLVGYLAYDMAYNMDVQLLFN